MLQLVATSTTGLESVVSSELKKLGYAPRNSDVGVGRTYFEGNFSDLIKANIWLRTAGKILIVLAEFDVYNDFDVIFDAVRAVEWENFAPRDARFLVEGRSVRSTITSVPALQRTVKKAIVDRLSRIWHTSTLPETGPLYTVEISLLKDKASITLDTTGRGLHRRGYRTMNVAAPLRETLASALVQLSVWNPNRPLIDPFCASGTIPIEAAMIGRNIAPGLKRTFVSQGWPTISETLWHDAREEARASILPPLKEKIHGSDIDAEALKFARQHAVAAGVNEDVAFFQRDFYDLEDNREYGCVICNPPYGDRIGELGSLQSLYESIPAVLSRLPTWSHYIITNWLDLENTIGQEATRRRKLYNSRTECVYFQFLGPKPPKKSITQPENFVILEREGSSPQELSHSPKQTLNELPPAKASNKSSLETPAFAGLDDYAEHQATEFGRCLANCVRRLRRYPARGITCYRLYDKDFPEVPLAIDVFEGKWLHIAEYERPDGRSAGQHRLWLDKMIAKAAEIVDIPIENVFVKRRTRQRGKSQYEKLTESGRVVRVHEGGLTFLCNMTDYLDVGLFLDHRQTRALVRREALGKRFLNLFCYSGSFTCYAADGGASSTVSVDLSPTYLDWATANLEENQLTTRDWQNVAKRRMNENKPVLPTENLFIKSDVIRFLKAIPPASDRNRDVVRLIEETASEVGTIKRRAHYERNKENRARKKYYKKRDGDRLERGALPEYAFGISRSDFELCICDPPTFSNSKSTDSDWDVQHRHVELLRLLATRMKPGGVVYFSNNFRKFKLDEESLVDLYDFREISNRTIPEDFRNKKTHRCWRMIAK